MIKDWQQYQELDDLVWQAEDRLNTGQGASGVHYVLMYALRNLGIFANGREDTITQGKKLLKEFEEAQRI